MQYPIGSELIEQMQHALQLFRIAKDQLSDEATAAEFDGHDALAFIESVLNRFCEPLDESSAAALFKEIGNNTGILIEAFNRIQDSMHEDNQMDGAFGSHQLQVDPNGFRTDLVDASTSPQDLILIEKLISPFQMAAANPEVLQPILEKSSNLFTKVYVAGGHERATRHAKSGAKARLKKDPKTEEKEFIKMKWKEWQRGESSYKTQEAFADAMDLLTKELVCNHSTINGWIRAWKKETN